MFVNDSCEQASTCLVMTLSPLLLNATAIKAVQIYKFHTLVPVFIQHKCSMNH